MDVCICLLVPWSSAADLDLGCLPPLPSDDVRDTGIIWPRRTYQGIQQRPSQLRRGRGRRVLEVRVRMAALRLGQVDKRHGRIARLPAVVTPKRRGRGVLHDLLVQ